MARRGGAKIHRGGEARPVKFDRLPEPIVKRLGTTEGPGESESIRPGDLPRILRAGLDVDREAQLELLSVANRLCGRDSAFRQALLEDLPRVSYRERTQRFRALEDRGDENLCTRLSRFTRDPCPRVRYHLVGVCRGGYSPCLDNLKRGARDHRRDVAARAAARLAGTGTDEARERAVDGYGEEFRPLVKIAYLREFTSDPHPTTLSLARRELDRAEDRRLRFHAACLLKTHRPEELARRARGDAYLKRIHDRVPVKD